MRLIDRLLLDLCGDAGDDREAGRGGGEEEAVEKRGGELLSEGTGRPSERLETKIHRLSHQ